MSVSNLVVGGRLIAVKRRDAELVTLAGNRGSRTELADEVAVLAVATHPGVVALADMSDLAPTDHVDEAGALWLAHVGEHTWSTRPPSTPVEIAAAVAAVATIVADLHDLGVTHGQLDDPGHIIVGPGDQLVLCGFSRARYHDGPADASTTQRRTDDVQALGRLATLLLNNAPDPSRIDRSARGALEQLIALSAGAGTGTTAALSARDMARRAADVARATPRSSILRNPRADTARRNRRADTARRNRRAGTARRNRLPVRLDEPRRALVAVALAAGLVAIVVVSRRSEPNVAPEVLEPVPSPSVTTTAVAPSTTNTTAADPVPTPTSAPAITATPAPSAPTTTAAPTATEPAPTGPLVIDNDGQQFQIDIGARGVIAVGDWDCDGRATVVALDVETSRLWSFDSWATPEQPVEARLLTTVVGATGIEPATSVCPALLVSSPEGPQTVEIPS